jgi:outer membrane protein assembly factor BamD
MTVKTCQRFGLILLSLIFLLAASSGCGSRAARKAEPTLAPEELYNSGISWIQKKKWDRAAESFRKFKEEYPLNEAIPLAELRLADVFFLEKKYAEAILAYEDFKKLHPAHPEIPYAIFQIGMCHAKQMRTIDRDQSETEKAIEQFRYLIANFPQSPHSPEAQKMILTCQRHLADYELYVARFYLRTQKYKAALGRLEGIMQRYPDVGLENEIRALYKTCRTALNKEEEKKRKSEEKGKKAKGAGSSG